MILVRRPCMWSGSHPCIESHETALYDTDACIANQVPQCLLVVFFKAFMTLMHVVQIRYPSAFLAHGCIFKSLYDTDACIAKRLTFINIRCPPSAFLAHGYIKA